MRGSHCEIATVKSFAGFPSASKSSADISRGVYPHRRLFVPLSNNYLSLVEKSFFSDKCSDFASIDASKHTITNRQKYSSAPDLNKKSNLGMARTYNKDKSTLQTQSMESMYHGHLDPILEKQYSGDQLRLPGIDLSNAKTKKPVLRSNIQEQSTACRGRLQKMRKSIGELSSPMENRLRKMRKSLDLLDGKIHFAPKHLTLGSENHENLNKSKEEIMEYEKEVHLRQSKEKIMESTSMHSFSSSRSRFSDSDSSKKSGPSYGNKQKVNYGAKFKRLAKFLTVLFGLWKEHAKKVKEFMETNVDLLEVDEPIDLLFDVTKFRADKQALLSEEVKQILLKRPQERAEDEMKMVRVAIGNYKAIAEYPLHMKRLMSQRAWCETVDPKRVIVQQGHPSRYFYFILSGSVIVTKQEEGTTVSKTDCFLGRGDSFGELGLINNAPRRATVISKERVELLVFSDEDYVDIFMSGGLHNKEDPFLKSLPCFKGWPIEMLADNPNQAFLSYFKRGTALVLNSTFLDWIIIVKSGSCKVLKRLHKVRPSSEMSKLERHSKSQLLDGHEAVIDQHLVVAQLRAEQRSMVYRKRMLQDLELKIELYPITNHTRDESFALEQLASENELHAGNNGNVREEPSNQLSDTENNRPDTNQVSSENGSNVVKLHARIESDLTQDSITEEPTIENKEVPFITKAIAVKNPSIPTTVGRETKRKDLPKEKTCLSKDSTRVSWADMKRKRFQKFSKKVKNVAKAVDKMKNKTVYKEKQHTIVDDLNERYLNMYRPPSAHDGTPVFVRLQTLTAGSVFGLHDILHQDQPSLSLVSNGSECVIISKKLFLEHCSKECLRELKNQMSPFPPDSYFQEGLQVYIDWIDTKVSTYGNALYQTQLKKADPNDSRSLAKIAAIIGTVEKHYV